MTNLSTMLLESIHYCSVENILTYCITAWYERRQSSYQDRYQYGTENHWTPIYRSCCLSRACNIVKDNFHHLSSLLPSGRRYRDLKSCSPRLQNGFYPTAISKWNLHSQFLVPPQPLQHSNLNIKKICAVTEEDFSLFFLISFLFIKYFNGSFIVCEGFHFLPLLL